MQVLGALALVLPLHGALATVPPVPQQERPNVLLVVTDDQRHDSLGCAGHPVLRTPSIDRLAGEGTRFENAFVTTPICAASRASILTGTWERRHGYTFGTPPLGADEIAASYPALLRAAGYRTGFVGKFGVRGPGDAPEVMFDFFRSYGQPFVKELEDGSTRHLTDLTGDDALEFLAGCDGDEPFCLTVSFNAPHAEDATKSNPFPHSPPEAELYVDSVLPPPLVQSDFWEGLPEFFADSLNRVRWFWRWDSPEKYDRFLRDHYRMISGIDRVVGDILQSLERRGLADDTVVIFTSDNGYYMGSRGFAGKWSHYDESLRVPLIVCDPRAEPELRGRVVRDMALNVDIAPTILDLAGVAHPASHQGTSLVPVVRGEPGDHLRDEFLFEHLFDHPQIPRMEGVRGERYVYARYVDHLPEGEFLHDLATDPLELVNLAGDPSRADLLAQLRRRCNALVALAGAPAASAPQDAAPLPREDVVHVPAIGEGLCVSNLFQSHMVLQRDRPIAVWGWAAPGERVTVAFGPVEATATADSDRRWRVTLPAMSASAAPRTMTVSGAAEALALEDVLVGDVWLLGGQSNMEFELAKVENGALEIASANFPQIRILTVPYGVGPEPRASFARLHEWSDWFGRHFRKGDWDVCTPEVARELSAIGHAFARRVHLASGVPIGVIDASRGGTTVEAWTPAPTLRGLDDPAVADVLDDWDGRVASWDAEADLARRVEEHRAWLARMEDEGREVPDDRRADPTDLRPGPVADPNLPGSSFAGMIGPLAGLSIKGALFHQGFNNALQGMPGVRLYRATFPALIAAWRETFGDPHLPFGILSLCTEGYPQTRDAYLEKMVDSGVFIRAVQYEAFLALRDGGDANIGFASSYDLRRRWYHPQLKLPAGERLARWALATQYGFGGELAWEPPRLVSSEPQGGALALTFDTEVGDPEDGAIQGFAIAGADRRFQPADVAYARVEDGDRDDRRRLVLSSPLVPAPLHFRFAWARNPHANLQATGNRDLPVATQRSDDWDLGTAPLDVLDSPIEGKLTRAQRNQLLEALRADDLRRRLAEAEAFLEAQRSGDR